MSRRRDEGNGEGGEEDADLFSQGADASFRRRPTKRKTTKRDVLFTMRPRVTLGDEEDEGSSGSPAPSPASQQAFTPQMMSPMERRALSTGSATPQSGPRGRSAPASSAKAAGRRRSGLSSPLGSASGGSTPASRGGPRLATPAGFARRTPLSAKTPPSSIAVGRPADESTPIPAAARKRVAQHAKKAAPRKRARKEKEAEPDSDFQEPVRVKLYSTGTTMRRSTSATDLDVALTILDDVIIECMRDQPKAVRNAVRLFRSELKTNLLDAVEMANENAVLRSGVRRAASQVKALRLDLLELQQRQAAVGVELQGVQAEFEAIELERKDTEAAQEFLIGLEAARDAVLQAADKPLPNSRLENVGGLADRLCAVLDSLPALSEARQRLAPPRSDD